MTGHTRTDGLAGMALPPQELPPESARPGSAAKLQCHACPVLCQIAPGRAGACDRYANPDGALVRCGRGGGGAGAAGGADASADTAAPWSGDLLHADEVFVTGVGASTTYPDYKPAP